MTAGATRIALLAMAVVAGFVAFVTCADSEGGAPPAVGGDFFRPEVREAEAVSDSPEATGTADSAALAGPEPPGSPPVRPLEELLPGAIEYLAGRSPNWAFAIILPGEALTYETNGFQQFPMASLAKVVILLAFLAQHDTPETEVSAADSGLLESMITESDNAAAALLWERIGERDGFEAFLAAHGIHGVHAAPEGYSWGDATTSAVGMAQVLGLLYDEAFLSPGGRAQARDLLSRVVEGQRWGASAAFGPAAPPGDYGIKNGWYPALTGWRVNSAAISLSPELEQVIIVGLTRTQESFEYGVETIERIAQRLGTVLHGAPVEPLPAAPDAGPGTTLERFDPSSDGLAERAGVCDEPSRTVRRDGALSCIVEAVRFDPCFVDGEAMVAICGAVPRSPGDAFSVALERTPPVIAPPDAGQPWYIERADGVACVAVRPETINEDADRATYTCDDGSRVIGPLQQAPTWWAYVAGGDGPDALVRVATAWF